MTDAALVIEDGAVAWTGPAGQAPAADSVVDAGGRAVLPGFVDSHAHLVFAGERSAEFAARMAGRPYQAGGILTTVAATRAASDTALRANLRRLAAEMLRQGTTTFECKSGYGLTVPTRPARSRSPPRSPPRSPTSARTSCRPSSPATCPATWTWCAARCWTRAPRTPGGSTCSARTGRSARTRPPPCWPRAGPAASAPASTPTSSGPGPGIRVAAEAGAAAADHCTYLTEADLDTIVSAPLVATLLPGAEFGTRHPYPDARRLLDAGATVALATDCNPGSSFTSSMAVLHRAGRPRHADDHPGGGLGRHRGRRPGPAPHRRRPPRRRRPGRPDPARRPVARLPGLPPRRPPRSRRLAVRPPSRGRHPQPDRGAPSPDRGR